MIRTTKIIIHNSYYASMRVKYRLCECARLEQREAKNHRVRRKRENCAVQIVRYNHTVYKYGIDTHANHNEEALKTECKKAS